MVLVALVSAGCREKNSVVNSQHAPNQPPMVAKTSDQSPNIGPQDPLPLILAEADPQKLNELGPEMVVAIYYENDRDGLLKWLSSLNSMSKRHQAFNTLGNRAMQTHGLDEVNAMSKSLLDPDAKALVAGALIVAPKSNIWEALALRDLYFSPKEASLASLNDAQLLAHAAGSGNHEEAMEVIAKIGTPENLSKLLVSTYASWAGSNPEEAANHLLTRSESDATRAAWRRLGNGWSKKDPASFEAWRKQLPAHQRAQVLNSWGSTNLVP